MSIGQEWHQQTDYQRVTSVSPICGIAKYYTKGIFHATKRPYLCSDKTKNYLDSHLVTDKLVITFELV